jgi:hypothetical protein
MDPVAGQVKRLGLPLGIGIDKPLVPLGDDLWRPMTDEEVESWIAGG